MSEEITLNTGKNDPIPPDPQLAGSFPREIKPEPIALNQNIPDPITIDANLSSVIQKSLNPDVIAHDPQLTSRIIEGHHPNTVLPPVASEYKSTSQPNNTQQQPTEKE